MVRLILVRIRDAGLQVWQCDKEITELEMSKQTLDREHLYVYHLTVGRH